MKLIKKGYIDGKGYFVYVVKDIREIKVDFACFVCPKCGCWGDVEAVKNLDIHISYDNKVFMKKSNREYLTFRCRSCSFWDVINEEQVYYFVVGAIYPRNELKIYLNEDFYNELDKDYLENVVDSVYEFCEEFFSFIQKNSASFGSSFSSKQNVSLNPLFIK